MKGLHRIFPAAIVMALMLSCEGGVKKSSPANEKSTDEEQITVVAVDSMPTMEEVVGIVGDGSTMNYLEVITKDNNTLSVMISDTPVYGSLMAGQSVDVIYNEVEGDLIGCSVVNLSLLKSVWEQIDSKGNRLGLTLMPDGTVATENEDNGYKAWDLRDSAVIMSYKVKMHEYGTVEHADTFSIGILSNDTLQLLRGDEAVYFVRKP